MQFVLDFMWHSLLVFCIQSYVLYTAQYMGYLLPYQSGNLMVIYVEQKKH